MSKLSNCDVFIVGAGPTGLMLALELARQGISFEIIDKNDNVSEIMKATAISSVALEGFDDLGLAAPFERNGVFTHALSIYAEGKQKMHLPWVGIESKFPGYCLIGQNHVEAYQQQFLNKMGHVVHWQTKFEALSQNSNGVSVTISKNNVIQTIHCQFLIACDGSRSPVREAVGIELKGKSYPQHYIIADVEIEGDFDRSDWYFFLSKNGFSSVGAIPNNRWGVLLSLPRQQKYAKGDQPTLNEVQTLFNDLSDIPGTLINPNWISHFHTYLKYVKSRQKGRVFLCGDAAHQVSPLTSLGMNSGMLDARNIAWKLALVCKGIASEQILETYSVEQNQTLKFAQMLSDANERSFSMTGFITREFRDHLTEIALGFEPLMRYFGGTLSQTNISFSKSPIIDEFIGFPFHTDNENYHLTSESSCLNAWSDFGKGIKPGARAPDIQGVYIEDSDSIAWLFDNLLNGKHGLIVFTGRDSISPERLGLLDDLLLTIENDYNELINMTLITIDKAVIRNIKWQGKFIYDKEGIIHNRYGATGDCLYLIRPDRFVGYRSLPPRLDKLQNYLFLIFGG